eukprot:GHVO01001543.1.p1 GENE.GHVO01001543.1~~GHVO01001543.1.p1  ORF type:complete len:192 (+),score=29.90 GHVO01001543.1:78-653(+)
MSAPKSKIEIEDRSISNEIDSRVGGHFKSIVDTMEWDEDSKRKVLQQFKQMYREALHENITVNGQSWKESEDSKSESKQKNRKKYLNTQLVPEANEAMVEVAKQRKTFPFLCGKELANQCSYECSYEQKIKVKPKFSDLSLPSGVSPSEEQREELKEKMKICKDLVQTIPSQVHHAEELLLATEIIPSCSN